MTTINRYQGECPVSDASQSNDALLRERAAKVVPGGMWGHLNATNLPKGYPQFFAKGEGAWLWDVNGRRYVDFMCAWGPNLLGYRHPEVDAAAARQNAKGDCLNGPGEAMVELAEALVDTIAAADWTQFMKNGTDATTSCVTFARAATGKRKILVARGAYHGAVPWCSPSLVGVTSEDRAHIVVYEFNDAESLAAAVAVAGDDLAAILVSAFRHDFGKDQELPSRAFAQLARQLCDAKGAALIIDEVRTGLRLDLSGSWEQFGVRPDLSAWSKAIANGYSLAAVTGADWLREAASKVFVTGSFWFGAVAMAAGIETLKIARRDDIVEHMDRLGRKLREGLNDRALKAGLQVRQTGPVQMPVMLFDDDPDCSKGNLFCSTALEAGVFFHPKHTMFLCAAHTDADIEAALQAAERGFAAVANQFQDA
ncbi:aminotransferase class III-fold pyridoxal phosphate-dependent enzyme [Corticibacterium sp. UT-5YL-CI-8]|nr:aminotransferase class III-fold pyridoxal phosphate-dependent enzyme [Tianweitania sp. UT-5YL-CI-8]